MQTLLSYIPMQMSGWARGLVVLLVVVQAGAMLAEMFRWGSVANLLTEFSEDVIAQTRFLGANMGLYNGFLAAGLVWSLLAPPALGVMLAVFFAFCVQVAGVFGFATVPRNGILLLIGQGLTAACAVVALFL